MNVKTVSIYSVFFCLISAGAAAQEIWMPLFNGKDLTGWNGHTGTWFVDPDSAMIYTSGPVPFGGNTFIWTDSVYSDFELRISFRMEVIQGVFCNSGIQVRSYVDNPDTYVICGYQSEIGDSWWGEAQGECCAACPGGRFWDRTPECEALLEDTSVTSWNSYKITLDGSYYANEINGTFCGESSAMTQLSEGVIGMQLHAPGGFQMSFRDIYIRPLNNSFTIPDSLAVTLDESGQPVTGLAGKGTGSFKPRLVKEHRLFLTPALAEKFGSDINVSLRNISGQEIFSRSVSLTAARELSFPARKQGVYLLTLTGRSQTESWPVFLD